MKLYLDCGLNYIAVCVLLYAFIIMEIIFFSFLYGS